MKNYILAMLIIISIVKKSYTENDSVDWRMASMGESWNKLSDLVISILESVRNYGIQNSIKSNNCKDLVKIDLRSKVQTSLIAITNCTYPKKPENETKECTQQQLSEITQKAQDVVKHGMECIDKEVTLQKKHDEKKNSKRIIKF